jgi:hypothetical protein
MIKKRIVGFGAIIGLAFGGIAILAGVFLPGDSPLVAALFAVESPLMHVINWLSKGTHSWGVFTAIYISFVLIYWTLIGLLIGLSIRWFMSRKNSHAA